MAIELVTQMSYLFAHSPTEMARMTVQAHLIVLTPDKCVVLEDYRHYRQ